MRYRDCPTTEVTRRIAASPEAAWAAVTDIALPVGDGAEGGGELRAVEWLDGASEVAVGARFRGTNANVHLGEWQTDAEVVDVEDGRRWAYDVGEPGAPWATWGFEVDPVGDGVVVRHWMRMGPNRSGLSVAIDAMPEKEGRIVERRLAELATSMAATLERLDQRLTAG